MKFKLLSVVGLAAAAIPALAGVFPPACPGDADGDNAVGLSDIAVVSQNWEAMVPVGTMGDLDGDGLVGLSDIAVIISNWGNTCVIAQIVDEELAGNGLAAFPHFEFVQSFNRGGAGQVAIDPAKHPDVVNQSGRLYVVADKDTAGWLGDPSLTDVRASGFNVVNFVAGGIELNRPTITDFSTLDSGTLVARAYDVVIDFNENGRLDGGDFIDGRNSVGLWVVKDLTTAGPYAVTTVNVAVTGVTAGFTSERIYYPTNIATLGQLPLVIMSHGNGHNFAWYDYLGTHLASHGYIFMSHANDTVPGIETASTTTLQHTQALIAQQGTLAAGVLNGRIDTSRISWLGHSRGGEGVTRAYDRIRDGTFVPSNYGLANIVLVSSIAPTDFLGTNSSNTYDENYHLIYGSSDGDVCGCASSDIADSFNLYERSFGNRISTYMYGTGHNEYNCCGFADATGPALIGRAAAQVIARGYYLALLEYIVQGSNSTREYFWRHYERFKPVGASATAVVCNELKDINNAANKFVIDDFQTNAATNLSSSGGAVTFDVLNIFEGLMHDNNTSFTWLATDPMNGMTRGRATDTMRAVVFDYTVGTPRFMEWAIPAAAQDTSPYTYLSFRACQGTRHPETIADLTELTFNVTVRDGNGVTATINMNAYGAGCEEPYQRTGEGTGTGWQNAHETTRIRLSDFCTNGNGLDLTNIVAVRFDFGAAGTNARGRVAVDDLEFAKE